MTRSRTPSLPKSSAIAACLCATSILMVLADTARGQLNPPMPSSRTGPYAALRTGAQAPYPASNTPPVAGDPNVQPTSASWIVPIEDYQSQPYQTQPYEAQQYQAQAYQSQQYQGQPYVDADVYYDNPPYPTTAPLLNPSAGDAWGWQVLPDGLIYRSYQAGVHESRIGIVFQKERDGRSLWDATLGGRVGLLRYGTGNPMHPEGWQIDFEGAAMPRLTLDDVRDLESVDFRGGVLATYGTGDWQFKFGYYHLSAHLGDEFAIRNIGSLDDRINYVRDALVLGASYYVVPFMRVYSEAGYCVNKDGGADPWEIQFGTEFSQPGPTGFAGTPFLALNGHLREEHNFGGDFTAQAGWLWRGMEGQTMRVGLHYFNGKSSQYQTFDDWEEQIGFGAWYDF